MIFAQTKNPGLKISLADQTFNYMTKQLLPMILEEIAKTPLPDQHTSFKKSGVKGDLDLTSLRMGGLSVSSPFISIVGNELSFVSNNVHANGHGNWHYCLHPKITPKICDSGSLDLDIAVSVSVKFGAVLDPSKKNKLRITCSQANIGFNHFGVKLHGGASWLYNFIISEFSGTIKKSIASQISKQIPALITEAGQKAIDDLDLSVEIKKEEQIFFDYDIETFVMNQEKQYLTLGVDAFFEKEGIEPYHGESYPLPETSTIQNNSMVSLFIDPISANSAFDVLGKNGDLTYVLQNEDIPEKFHTFIQLKTSFFKFLIPEFYKHFPEKDFEIVIKNPDGVYPVTNFRNGLNVEAEIDLVFRVLDEKKNTKDAFTIRIDAAANGTASVTKKSKEGKNTQYALTGRIDLQTYQMKLVQSEIGFFNLSPVEKTIQFLLKNIVMPLVNTLFEGGLPFPDLPGINLVDPMIKFHDSSKNGFLEVSSSFTYTPPTNVFKKKK